MSNTTETETLAMEFGAVLSVQRRFGLSTLYRLTRRENGATIAGPCQSENALEGACRLLNIVLRQKKNAHRLTREENQSSKDGKTKKTPIAWLPA